MHLDLPGGQPHPGPRAQSPPRSPASDARAAGGLRRGLLRPAPEHVAVDWLRHREDASVLRSGGVPVQAHQAGARAPGGNARARIAVDDPAQTAASAATYSLEPWAYEIAIPEEEALAARREAAARADAAEEKGGGSPDPNDSQYSHEEDGRMLEEARLAGEGFENTAAFWARVRAKHPELYARRKVVNMQKHFLERLVGEHVMVARSPSPSTPPPTRRVARREEGLRSFKGSGYGGREVRTGRNGRR